MSIINDLEEKLELNSNIGKEAIFIREDSESDTFGFCSELPYIHGNFRDVRVKSGTKLIILSDIITIDVPKYKGVLDLVKVLPFGCKACYMQIHYIKIIPESN